MSEEIKLSDIDVSIGIWDDCPKGYDPDMYSDKLREYQRALYSGRETKSGKKFNLTKGNWYEYLLLDDPEIRLSSDCIINMNERYVGYKERHEELLNEASEEYKELYQKYIHTAHTIGGEILFPRHRPSINTARGVAEEIKDRFDLTLECIKRFYDGKENPLSYVLKMDKEFFDLFVDFDGYVKFFFLDGLVKNGEVQFFFGEYDDNIFNHKPLAYDKKDWEKLLKKQMDFLEHRNGLIQDFCKGKKN